MVESFVGIYVGYDSSHKKLTVSNCSESKECISDTCKLFQDHINVKKIVLYLTASNYKQCVGATNFLSNYGITYSGYGTSYNGSQKPNTDFICQDYKGCIHKICDIWTQYVPDTIVIYPQGNVESWRCDGVDEGLVSFICGTSIMVFVFCAMAYAHKLQNE